MSVYIIAEIGINYNNSLDNCYKLIDAAADAGCDAAKFQIFSAKKLYIKSAGKLDWQDGAKKYSYDIYQSAKKQQLPLEWVDRIIEYCNTRNIDFMASVPDADSLEYLVSKEIKAIKLSSYTITHIPLIVAAAETGLPIIMSTGGASIGETEAAVNAVKQYHNKLTILHCSIQYPTKLTDVNMGVLDTFSKAFPDIKFGYSDHTSEISDAPIQSVYLGGAVIEKHITLDKNMDGPDHFFALEPDELIKMVVDVRRAEQERSSGLIDTNVDIYGSSEKKCFDHEKYLRDFAYMSIFSNKDIKKGDVISCDDLSILRSGKKENGLDPKYMKLFEEYTVRASKDIEYEAPITWESILNG